MKIRSALLAFAVAGVLGSTETRAQNAYIANTYSNTVSVIDVATNTVRATISGFDDPQGVGVSPDGRKVYVGNYGVGTPGSVAVINTATNAVTTITDASFGGPVGIAVTPDSKHVYVGNLQNDTVSVIDTATNAVTDTISVGQQPVRGSGDPGRQQGLRRELL